jgi:DHA1 family multidrug resistance protein-like MFS transporter
MLEKLGRFLALEGNIRVLAMQAFISQIGLGMFFVIWQPYLLSTGITVGQLGLVQTLINISTGIGMIVWGNLSDRIGRKPVVISSTICRIVALLCLIVSENFIAFLTFGFFMGITAMYKVGNPARNALIAESVDSTKRATALSTLITISQGISTIVASAGGWIALKMGFTPIFYIAITGDIIGTFLLWRYLKETYHPKPVEKKRRPMINRIKDILMPENELKFLYAFMLAQGFSYGVAYSLFFGTLTDSYGLTTLELGLMTASFNLVWTIDSIPLGKLVDKIGRIRGMQFSILMALLSAIGFIFFKRIEFFIFFYGLSAVDLGFWIPSYTIFVSELVSSEKRSTVFGKLDAYNKIGSIPAPWIGALLYESYGFNAPLYVHVIIGIFSMYMVSKLLIRIQ